MRSFCKAGRRRREWTTTVETPDDLIEEETEDQESEDISQVSDPCLVEEVIEEISLEDSTGSEKSVAVQEILSKEMSEITEPFLFELSNSDYELLQSESSLKIKIIADDIVKSIIDERQTP